MKLQSEISISDPVKKIEHCNTIMTLGSCFASNIAEKLAYYRFTVADNPFGVLYNPASIAQALNIMRTGKHFTKNDLIEYNGLWHSFYHHGQFSHEDVTTCLKQINTQLTQTRSFLHTCDFLFITLGTAYVYTYTTSNTIVSNCHKIPGTFFKRALLSQKEIEHYLHTIISDCTELNPGIQIIFTLSPVRYWPKQATENQISKSLLTLSIHSACAQYKHTGYFPAYELLLDELRDYRFYAADLVHPNQLAIDYIWEKLFHHYLSAKCRKILPDMTRLSKALQHKSFDPDSQNYKSFKKNQLKKLDETQKLYPYLDLSEDYKHFS